jgi:glutamate carboxypeptidase
LPSAAIASSQDLLDELAIWVKIETPTRDAVQVNKLMDLAEGQLAAAGAEITRIPGRDGFGDNLVIRASAQALDPAAKPILFSGHLDTVWPVGTIETMPFKIDGDKAYGPGILDMKAGSFAAFYALRAILTGKIKTKAPIVLLLTPDEEVGSPTSQALIEQEAAKARATIIPEPAWHDGRCVTARKGVGIFDIEVKGVNSHAGSAFEAGASAVVELARQIVRLNDMVDLDAGVTVNVAPITGGVTTNVISDKASGGIDLRVPDATIGDKVVEAILGLQPVDPRCKVTVTGGMNRPAWAESAESLALYEKVKAMASNLGLPITKMHRGGGSDGNFTAALGIPTIDGLGCAGTGAHAPHEHIQWRELEKRVALMASIMEGLE